MQTRREVIEPYEPRGALLYILCGEICENYTRGRPYVLERDTTKLFLNKSAANLAKEGGRRGGGIQLLPVRKHVFVFWLFQFSQSFTHDIKMQKKA